MLSVRALIAVAFVGAGLVGIGSQASANIVNDGTFSAGLTPGAANQYYLTYTQGQSIDGVKGPWIVLDNSVDVDANGFGAQYGWPEPFNGACCSVDLVGSQPNSSNSGGIYQQLFPTATGKYVVSFYVANNFWSTPTASANVEVGDAAGDGSLLLQNFSHDTSSSSDMNWTLLTYSFVVSNLSTPLYLSFDTTYGASYGGIALADVNVSLDPAPLPAAFSLFAGGLGVIGLFARRKRRKVAMATGAAS